MNIESIDKTISALTKALMALNKLKAEMAATPEIAPPEIATQETAEFDELVRLLHSNDWPVAADPEMICDENNEKDRAERADSILDLILIQPIQERKFLDFGCGDGSVVSHSLIHKPALAVGYDIQEHADWQKPSDVIFTTDFQVVHDSGPYNLIAAYDVLDHLEGIDLIDALQQMKSVLAPGGEIFIRFHPFTSPHAAHLYRSLNKAYIHLVFTPEELKTLGLVPHQISRIIHPLNSYKQAAMKVGLSVKSEMPHVIQPSSFFANTPVVAKRIKAHWHDSTDLNLASGKSFPNFQLSINFVDLVLSHM